MKADRVKIFWKRLWVCLFCKGNRLLPLLLTAPSMRLTLKRRTNHLLSLLSIPVFTTCSQTCEFGSRGLWKGWLYQASCSTAGSREGEKGTHLFAVVKSILVAVGQVKFVNLSSASLLSLHQFIQGSVELLLTWTLQEYHAQVVNTKITRKSATQKVIRI